MIEMFGYAKIAEFVKSQLSAGKKNYDEHMFFEAYSEILNLIYFGVFGPNYISASYEPNVGRGNSNPEASFKYEDGTYLEIEVKTARITKCFQNNESYMPLRCMSLEGITKFEKRCKKLGVFGVRPRVGKLKDYINSACAKFSNITDDSHYNILVINWSSTEIKNKPCLEPAMLLANTANGIFYHKDIASIMVFH